jgi:radical SAM-linked protein
MGKLKAMFSKTGDMRFISHLDLMRLFQRAVRRSDLPVTMTKGFSPHLKISVTRALKLGVESCAEEAVFQLDSDIAPDRFVGAMNANIPDGVRILSAERIS